MIVLDWKIFIAGYGLLTLISLINTKLTILPVSSTTFILCSLFVWILSMCITFVCIHKLLQSNEPLWLKRGKKEILTKERQDKKPNPERVKALAKQIDGYFISKWYINISKDASFPGECRVFLEETITRLAEVQLGVNNKVLLHACLNIFLRHSKEFRRGLKRKEKYGGTIEELYRYSHLCSNNTKAKICFIHGLTTNLMRHFINSELWGSLPSQILVSVIARKLVTFLSKLLSDPEVLNYILLNSLASETVKEKYKLSEYSHINISQYYDVTDSKDATSEMKMGKSVVDSGHTKSVNQVDALKENNGNHKTIGLDSKCIPVTAASSPRNINSIYRKSHTSRKNKGQKIDCAEELREEPLQKSSRSNPVKIHEPTARKSLKTYSDSKDLALGVSLGQDPLEAWLEPTENVKQGGKTSFWDPGKIEQYVEEAPAHANLLLNEVKLTTQNTMEGLKSSMKPISDATVHTLHNIKDLQESTVNNALHKIGDFQDEAAGMVGGILDFGRARLRKGLRLSGLQDNIENAKASLNLSSQSNKYQSKFRANKSTKHESPVQVSSEEATDSVWFNPLQMESPSFDGHILLEKTKKSFHKDKKELQIPFISMEQSEVSAASPDPEYEDTSDLASSIAKLRSLLQQKSSESSFSTPTISPIFMLAKYYGSKSFWVADKIPQFSSRPPDEIGQRRAEVENALDVDETDGVMPSFYKFCAKTATGVFDKTIHTIKTALPSNTLGVEQSDNPWIFVQKDESETDILHRMKKLLAERKDYCTLDTDIDTAYEAIDSLDIFDQPTCPNIEFEDELDDFEVKLPITKALVDIMCELLADTDSPLIREPLVKTIMLTLGNRLEKFVISKVEEAMEDLCVNLISIPETTNQNTLNLELDVFVEAVLDSFPDAVKLVVGKGILNKALTLFVSSLQNQKINEDVVLQIFELFALKLIEESNQISPPASA